PRRVAPSPAAAEAREQDRPSHGGRSAADASAPGTSAAQAPGGDTLDLEANLVLVSTVVTKLGDDKAVRDLRQSDFRIEDEGVPQQIAFFGDETPPLDVEFLFDASDSLKFRDRFQREALASF